LVVDGIIMAQDRTFVFTVQLTTRPQTCGGYEDGRHSL